MFFYETRFQRDFWNQILLPIATIRVCLFFNAKNKIQLTATRNLSKNFYSNLYFCIFVRKIELVLNMEYIFKVSKFFFSPLIVLTLKMIIWITKKEVVFGYEKKFYNVGASFYKIKSDKSVGIGNTDLLDGKISKQLERYYLVIGSSWAPLYQTKCRLHPTECNRSPINCVSHSICYMTSRRG